jgi:hypothetical protein
VALIPMRDATLSVHVPVAKFGYTSHPIEQGSIGVPTPAGVTVENTGHIWVSSPSYANGNSVFEFDAAGHQLTSFGNAHGGLTVRRAPGRLPAR